MYTFPSPSHTSRTLVTGALVALFTLGGCYASGRKVDQQTLVDLQPGLTTCLEIRQRYGVPTSAAVTSDGTQQLIYTYVQTQVRPETFIPIAGAFLRGGDTEQTQVVFDCDQKGVLTHYASTQGQLGSGTGFISGGKQK